MALPRGILAQAAIMADELESTRLTVKLSPSRRDPNGQVRVVESTNPDWYRKFCERYASGRSDSIRWRKHKTSVKRHTTIRALRNIAAGLVDRQPNGGEPYTKRLIPIIEAEMIKRHQEEAQIDRELAFVPF